MPTPNKRLGLLERMASTPETGFPSVTPVFGGMFLPAGNATQLFTSDSWSAFAAQTDTLAASGYRLASFTAIQSLNRTFFYGAFEQGGGNYLLLRTTDPNQFQQTFAAQKAASYRLVDFSINWEQGQLVYIGYWLAASAPKPQTLVWDVDFNTLGARWSDLSTNQGMRMTRVQAFPKQDAASFTGLFEQGTGSYALWYDTLNNFLGVVEGKFAGLRLVGLGYDPVNGMMVGCWRDGLDAARFVWNLDWETLVATAQKLAAKGLILRAVSVYPNVPSFDDYFAVNVAPLVRGYAYAVAKDGQITASGAGFARGSKESVNPNRAFTADARINLASVSKAVTGIALEVLLRQTGKSLDTPFAPLIAAKVPNPHPSVKTVTLRNLATMKSGLQPQNNEGPLDGDLWPYLNTYLAQPLVGTPGVTEVYCNTNFTILQGVIDQVSGMDYVQYVTQNVLIPAGMNPAIFSATPDPPATATLCYSGPNDALPGQYWNTFRFVAPGGWISTARELVKILMALRGASVLPADVISQMLTDGIGWYAAVGNFGTYYHHNGGLGNGSTPPQQLNTCIVRLGEGYDIALVVNSQAPADVVNLSIGAFDSRGLAASNPAISAVVHGASFLPKVAPGTFATIFGTGFTEQPRLWSDAIVDGATLPLELDGVRVRVGSQDAYVQFVSPGQINFLLPSNVPVGSANVQLTTAGGIMTSALEIDAVAPGFFAYRLNGTLYAAAVFANSAVYVARTGALPGSTSRPAIAGDILQVYGSGFGATNPVAPDGAVLTQVYPTADLSAFRATLGGRAANVLFAGLTFAGTFQVNVQVPAGLTGGDQALVLFVNNLPTQPNVMLTVQA